jgi:cytochrome c oxidase subunit IV
MSERTTAIPPANPHPRALAHVVSPKLLAAVFAALVLLTALTVAVAGVDLGSLNIYVALAIAGLKATLVVLFFMHLLYDRPYNRVVFLGCLLFVVIFISLVLKDAQSYRPSLTPGEAPAMKDVHRPFGQQTGP